MSSGLWYRTLVYLGLKEEPEEGYDDLPERGSHPGDASQRDALEHERFDPVDDPDARPVRAVPAARDEDTNVRPLRSRSVSEAPRPGSAGVRAAVVEVAAFEDVEAVGARYRTGQPVLFDVGGADRAVARRVVDFVSGLTYASHGRLSKAGTKAFLLVPDGVELPADEQTRLGGLGYRVAGGADA